jgi:DNA-directed RNA polymerase subunit M
MEFCPKCETRLKKGAGGTSLVCPKCQYIKPRSNKTMEKKSQESDSDLLVMEENDIKESRELESTVNIDCEKCHNQEGVSWTFQTRSADEPETKFYRCIKCNHTWRDYT